MQTRCPHCQEVFATDTPGVQDCPGCGKPLHVPALREAGEGPLDPFASPPSGERPRSRAETPWERRRQLGVLRALIETAREATFSPGRFFGALRPEGPLLDALLFGWILVAAGAALQLPFAFGDYRSVVSYFADLVAEGQRRGFSEQVRVARFLHAFLASLGPGKYALLQTVPRALFFPLFLVMVGSVLHLFCLLFGCAKNGFTATLRVLSYSMAPMLISGVPVLGALAALWFVVLVIWGLRDAHETNEVRAAFAVFGFPLVLCCCLGCLIPLSMTAAKPDVAAPEQPEEGTIELRHFPLNSPP